MNHFNNLTDEEDSKGGLLNSCSKVAEFENGSNNMSVEEDNEALRCAEKMASNSEPSCRAASHNTQQKIITLNNFEPNLSTKRKQTGKHKFPCDKCDNKFNNKTQLAGYSYAHPYRRASVFL